MAFSPRPARQAKLSRSVEKAFGEFFTIEAYKPSDDVNARLSPDPGRAVMENIVGTWHGPSKSVTPAARGSASDDGAHNWTASKIEVHFEDAALAWMPQLGDKITRLGDGSVYSVLAPRHNGFGRTVVPLTNRKKT